MSLRLQQYLLLSFGWTWLIGVLFYVFSISFSTPLGIALVALLYMPTPLVAALIVEKGWRRDRLRLPPRQVRRWVSFLLFPAVIIALFVVLYLALVYLGGNVLHLPGMGQLATTSEQLMQSAAVMLGQATVAQAGAPPSPFIVIAAALWGAILAGWTINGLFALTEEYGWRGLMWDELRYLGVVKANIIIGLVWGLWHAPLILQGYNYPGHELFGVVAMVCFTIPMSFLLSALRERSEGSVLPAAALHGMFNALGGLLIMIILGGNTLIASPLGVVGVVISGVLAAVLWWQVQRRGAVETTNE